MKKEILIGTIVFISLFIIPNVFAQEVKQEPEPPQIPEPTPEPEPIKLPEPEPVPEPFPEETESEKIQRLTEENNKLKQQNSNLQNEITKLQQQKSKLDEEINSLKVRIEKLHEITMEQIRVIMDLVNRLKEVIFEKPILSLTNL